jgi:hypothetical protein
MEILKSEFCSASCLAVVNSAIFFWLRFGGRESLRQEAPCFRPTLIVCLLWLSHDAKSTVASFSKTYDSTTAPNSSILHFASMNADTFTISDDPPRQAVGNSCNYPEPFHAQSDGDRFLAVRSWIRNLNSRPRSRSTQSLSLDYLKEKSPNNQRLKRKQVPKHAVESQSPSRQCQRPQKRLKMDRQGASPMRRSARSRSPTKKLIESMSTKLPPSLPKPERPPSPSKPQVKGKGKGIMPPAGDDDGGEVVSVPSSVYNPPSTDFSRAFSMSQETGSTRASSPSRKRATLQYLRPSIHFCNPVDGEPQELSLFVADRLQNTLDSIGIVPVGLNVAPLRTYICGRLANVS